MNYRKEISCTFVALFLVSAFHASLGAQEAEEPDKLARASARLVAKYIKEAIDEKTGLWVPPYFRHQYKHVPTGKTREVPAWETVGYKDVWKWIHKPTPDDPYNKVYTKVKVPIREKTGKMKTEPIYKRVSDVVRENHYFPRWIEGLNALGAYSLLCAGKHPQSSELNRVMEWLKTMAELGLPDTTPELSFMMMAFLRADATRYEDIIDRGITKILYGQITGGPSRGQWGNYCVNFRLLKIMDSYSEKLAKHQGVIKGLKVDKDFVDMSNKEKLAYYKKLELDGAISWVNRRMKEISRDFALGRLWYQVRWEDLEDDNVKKRYYWPEALYDARELRMGDLPNTKFALMALAEAQRAGWFEKKRQERLKKTRVLVLRRFKVRLKAPDPPDVTVSAARAAAMIKKFQKNDGTWDLCRTEYRTINPYKEMRNLKVKRAEPRHADRIKKHDITPADPTLIGTMSAMHSLALICEIAGKTNVGRKYGGCINKGKAAYEKILKDYLENNEAVPEHEHAFLPYRYWLTIPTIRNNLGLDALEGKDHALLKKILEMQDDSGSFGRPLPRQFRNRYMPPPQFPEEVQDLWVKEKVLHGHYLYPKLDPKLVCGALTLIFYSRHLKDNVTGPKDWPDVFEYFTKKRKPPAEIKPTAVPEAKPEAKPKAKPKKEPEEKPLTLPDPKKEALKGDEAF